MRRGAHRSAQEHLDEINAVAPAIPALEALRRNLLYQAIKRSTTEDAAEIMDGVIADAKSGDRHARKLYFDLIRIGDASNGSPTMQQAVIVNQKHGSTEVRFLSDAREQAALAIGRDGPMDTAQIASVLHIDGQVASHVLDHDWFEKDKNDRRYHLSAKGMAECVIPFREGHRKLLGENPVA